MSKLIPPNSSMMRVAATSWKAQTSWPVGMMKEGGRAQPVVPVSLGGNIKETERRRGRGRVPELHCHGVRNAQLPQSPV